MTTTLPLRCKCRRQAVTSLRCSRCFVPICPDCMVSAAVGMICRDCSRGGRSHLYDVDFKRLLAAYPVTLAAACFIGWLLSTINGIGFFGMFAGFFGGMGVGEIALRLTGRKRGLPIEILAGVCTLLGVVLGHVIGAYAGSFASGAPGALLDAEGNGMTHLGVLLSFLINPWSYVTLAVAVFGAVSRIRNTR